jgi:hypothetical protein
VKKIITVALLSVFLLGSANDFPKSWRNSYNTSMRNYNTSVKKEDYASARDWKKIVDKWEAVLAEAEEIKESRGTEIHPGMTFSGALETVKNDATLTWEIDHPDEKVKKSALEKEDDAVEFADCWVTELHYQIALEKGKNINAAISREELGLTRKEKPLLNSK